MRYAKEANVAGLAVGALGLLTASPVTAATPKSATEYFALASTGTTSTVVAHGLFTGGGKDDNSHDNYDVLYLGGGTLRINHPDAQSKYSQSLNPKSCFLTFRITGKYTLSNGTGEFAGVTGHGNYVVSGQGILASNKKGACSQQAEPIAQIVTITGSGPATLG